MVVECTKLLMTKPFIGLFVEGSTTTKRLQVWSWKVLKFGRGLWKIFPSSRHSPFISLIRKGFTLCCLLKPHHNLFAFTHSLSPSLTLPPPRHSLWPPKDDVQVLPHSRTNNPKSFWILKPPLPKASALNPKATDVQVLTITPVIQSKSVSFCELFRSFPFLLHSPTSS